MIQAKHQAEQEESENIQKTGNIEHNKSGLIVYSHGTYLSLGEELGTFGYSVRKK